MTKPLIIFDCDGVLVHTEEIANNRMAEIFSEAGFAISGHECRARFQGMAMGDVSDIVFAESGARVDGEYIREEVRKRLKLGVDAVEGVHELILSLKQQGYTYCVASSGKIKKMHTTLGQTPLLDLLKDVLHSADSVAHGKPDPAIFQFAAKSMGFAPTNAIVLEDSVPGVQAGVAAGAKVLAYCGDEFAPCDDLAKAGGICFDHMNDALSLIKDLS